mmetsp:Transcript_114/g.411  ORF Transcript_114/g.411 Transcript_114/m.411 type:complete len:211 (-) Transcript_114:922-1554(-)
MKTRYFAPSTIKMPGAVPGPFRRLAVVPSFGNNFSACHAPTVIQSNPPLFSFIARDVRTFSRSPGPVRITLSLFQYSAYDPLLSLQRSCFRGAPPFSSFSPFSVAWLQQPGGTGGKDSSSLPHALMMSASYIASSCPVPGCRPITTFHGTPVRISNTHAARLYSLTSTAFLTCCLFETLNSSGSSASIPNEKYGPLSRSPQYPSLCTLHP